MLPDVEGAPQPIRLSPIPGQRIPFDGSSHTRAAYLAAPGLFDPIVLASFEPSVIREGLRAAHPHMVYVFFS